MAARYTLPFTLTLIGASLYVHADDNTPLPDIVVTAARVAQPPREVIGDVSVISSADIQAHAGETLPQLLASQPGVQMVSNGGAGQPASLFLRGASAQQSVILIDGMRFTSATTGIAALQALSLDQIDHIEILRGPAGGLYGADAIGGVIQIFTRQGGAKTQAGAMLAGGNDGQAQARANLSGTAAGTRYALSAGHEESRGVEPLQHPGAHSSNAGGYYNNNGTLNLSHDWNANHQLSGSITGARSTSHYDNAFSQLSSGAYDYRTKASDISGQILAQDRWNKNWTSRVQLGASIDDGFDYSPVADYDYTKPTDHSDDINRIKTMNRQLSWQNDIAVGPGILSATAETLEQRVSGDTAYNHSRRLVNSVQAGYLLHIGAWQGQLDVRNDHNSQYGSHNSGTALLAWQFNADWQWGSSIGTGFRAPTFNELYYPGFGNPTLKPEQSVDVDTFLRFSHGPWAGRLTAFQNRERNLLQYDPTPSLQYPYGTTANVGRAIIRGFSLQGDWQGQQWSAGAHIDGLRAYDEADDGNLDKQLPRRAQLSGGAYVGVKGQQWHARAELQSQGRRYDDTGNTLTLGGYTVGNVLTGWQLSPHWSLSASVNNALNKHYEPAYGYNSLPRTYLLALNAQM